MLHRVFNNRMKNKNCFGVHIEFITDSLRTFFAFNFYLVQFELRKMCFYEYLSYRLKKKTENNRENENKNENIRL